MSFFFNILTSGSCIHVPLPNEVRRDLRYDFGRADQFLCLHAGCEGSFTTSKLLEEHGDVHTSSETSRLALNNFAVDTECNDKPTFPSVPDTYAPHFSSAANSSEGHVGTSSEHLGPTSSVGDLTVVNSSSNDNYVPDTVKTTRAHGPPAAGVLNKHNAAPFEWSDPFSLIEGSFHPGQPYDFSKGSVELIGPAHTGVWNGNIPAAHRYHLNSSDCIEKPFATNAASISKNALPTGPAVYANGHALEESLFSFRTSIANNPLLTCPTVCNKGHAMPENPFPTPASNIAPLPFSIKPQIAPRPMCTKCHQTFGRPSDLERHAKTHQAGPKDFKCRVAGCKYSSNRKDKFGEHVRRRHPSAGRA